MTTIKEQVLSALVEGDTTDELICFYQSSRPYYDQQEHIPVVECRFADLPGREFHSGFGDVEGEPTICFSKRYIYFRSIHDGAEEFVAVPRHPKYVANYIPLVGD